MDPERLAGLPLFADLDETERAELAACTREVTVPAGATVAAQGDNAYEFFVIETGEAEVRRGGEVIASVQVRRCGGRDRAARHRYPHGVDRRRDAE